MVPRVLIEGTKAPRRANQGGDRGTLANELLIRGPSHHLYRSELEPDLESIAKKALARGGSGTSEVRLLRTGSDVDTSEFILTRALDLLVVLLEYPTLASDQEALQALLVEQSDLWDNV